MAGRFPQTFLDTVLERTDLAALVGREVKLVPAGKELKGSCPFHDERSASFYVNPIKGVYNCFGCEAGGNAFTWLIDRQGMHFRDAVEALAQELGLEIPTSPDDGVGARRIATVRAALEDLLAGTHRRLAEPEHLGQALALGRALAVSPGTLERARIGFHPDAAALEQELLAAAGAGAAPRTVTAASVPMLAIPMLDERERVCALARFERTDDVGAAPRGRFFRATPLPGFDPETMLYALPGALRGARQQEHVWLVDGIAEVLRCHDVGAIAVASAASEEAGPAQLAALLRTARTVVVLASADEAGERFAEGAARASLGALVDGGDVRIAFVGPDASAGARAARLGLEGLHEAIDESVELVPWLVDRIVEQAGPGGRIAGLEQASSVLGGIAGGIYRLLALRYVDERLAGEIDVEEGEPSESSEAPAASAVP